MTRIRVRRRDVATATVIAALGVLAFTVSASAANDFQAVPAPPAVPTSADQIQNIDQVKTAIKGYYGDTTTSQLDPVNSTVALHQFGSSSSYAAEMGGIVDGAETYLERARNWYTPTHKAVLFDIDDTTLNTYSYEIYSNFVYNPSSNAAFVNACLTATGCVFPAVPHMVALEHWAESKGYAVFFLTGRPSAPVSQLPGTLANLQHVGYDVNANHVYLKDASGTTEPWLSPCAPSCTTIQYKSLTRKHIQSLGYDIVGNFGDQFSDLTGGYSDRTFKLPNPMYFLP
jgi:predicted secreted acid phosphatase